MEKFISTENKDDKLLKNTEGDNIEVSENKPNEEQITRL